MEILNENTNENKIEKKTVKFVCISDTHSKHKDLKLPEGDVLIHTGDFSNVGWEAEIREFSNYLKGLNYKHKIVIAGNHETTFEEKEHKRLLKDFGHDIKNTLPPSEMKKILKENCTYLENEGVEIYGYKIWGSPNTPEFYGWAFMDSDENLDKVWSQIPTDTDILLTHGPPYGIMDLCKSGESAGSATLLKQVLTRIKPIYHIFGHIHETYGEYQHPDIRTKFINASTCTYHYKPKNMPVVFELPIKK